METRIAENIRAYRKKRGLTQEQLSEVLGVSVGAVYKWESKSSLPELRLIVEMADFFDVSVDALLGYQMKDNRIGVTVDRLWEAGRTKDYAALSEAEKAIKKYPHSFDAVWACAFLYHAFGAESKKAAWMRRAIELMEKALLLLPQCSDPRLNESVLYGRMAEMYALLGDADKALELMKAHNGGGQYDDLIGFTLVSSRNAPEEAAPYLGSGLLQAVSALIRSVTGFILLFDARGDHASGKEIIRWIIPLLEGLKKPGAPCVLDKINAACLAALSVAQWKSGEKAEAVRSLRQAKALARYFDAAPYYGADRLKYAGGKETDGAYDALGRTAMEAVENALTKNGKKDAEMEKLWKEGSKDEAE